MVGSSLYRLKPAFADARQQMWLEHRNHMLLPCCYWSMPYQLFRFARYYSGQCQSALFYYKTKNLPELHVLQCTNAHPLEAFECFSLPYSDILRAQLITSKHAYTQMKTKGGISQDAAEQHAAGQTVYDKLAIVIQSKNPYHPYIELDFSNHTAVSAMWKSLQTSSILGNIFETETKFSISYAGCDTDIKIRKRFSAIHRFHSLWRRSDRHSWIC